MTFRRFSFVATAVATLAFTVAACTEADPTPIYVYLTPTPVIATPTPVATPTPTPTPTPTLTPQPTEAGESGSPGPTKTPKPTPTPTPTPTPGPAGPAGSCTGSQGNKDFFVSAANDLAFPVYCAHLPSGWYFGNANYEEPNGGYLKVSYKGPNGATFSISEGNYCASGADACAPGDKHIGNAKFGNLSGSLESVSGGFAIYVAPGTTQAYAANETGLSQATFVGFAAAIARVQKS